jgi:hypothetical protein
VVCGLGHLNHPVNIAIRIFDLLEAVYIDIFPVKNMTGNWQSKSLKNGVVSGVAGIIYRKDLKCY